MGSTKAVWILLVDDQSVVRLKVRQIIASQPDLVIRHEAGTIDEALDAVAVSRVDLAIVDFSLGPEDGLELVRRLRTGNAGLPILVYSLHHAALFADAAFSAGANAYVMKQEPTDRVIHAIREVLAGRRYTTRPE
jgi:two-component system, NarL family, invasion response regulator UvrY